MDMATLKAEHPDLYKAAFDAGKDAGKAEFQDFVGAHLQMAEMSGDYKRAHKDISEGNGMTMSSMASCQFHHSTLAQKNALIQARGDEAPPSIGEGEDQQAAAAADPAGDEDNVLVADAKAFYDGMVINV